MASSTPPAGPTVVRARPLVGERSLHAEHASWQLHCALRGRDFEDEAALQRFLDAHRDAASPPLPATASPADQAQALFYASRQSASWVLAREKRRSGLELDPQNVDLLVDRALLDRGFAERLALLDEAVALGDAFAAVAADQDEDAPRGWPVLTSRPGLRARAARILHLVELDRLDDAVEDCVRLLALDPEDHQGARYVHVALLLESKRYEEARSALDARRDEAHPILDWSRVLLAWALGEDAEAELRRAREGNDAVEEALLRPELLEQPPPERYAAGSYEEAEIVGEVLWRAWHEHPDALAWLRARAATHLRTDPEGSVWERILEADEGALRPGLLPFLSRRKDAVTPRLREYLGEASDTVDTDLGEVSALVLRRLGTAGRAIPELVAYLRTNHERGVWTESEALVTLCAVGETAVPAVLEAHAAEHEPVARHDFAEVLARSGVQRDEIFTVLSEHLDENPAMGAGLLQHYGDPRAVPLLLDLLERADPDPMNIHADVPDLLEAIQRLGGALPPELERRFAPIIEKQRHWETPEGERELRDMLLRTMQPDEEEASAFESDTAQGRSTGRRPGLRVEDLGRPSPGPVDLRADDRPGRNDPCWCGSGQKYKRCHLDEDEAERR